MTKLYTLLTLTVLTVAACKSASKAFDHGNYTEAIEIAVRKLQKDPSDASAKSVLQNAYKYAVSQHEEQITALSNSTEDNRQEKIYLQYIQLQRIYDNIKQSPAAMQAVKPQNYTEYVRTYKDKTADAYYQKGIVLLAEKDVTGNRAPYRLAYNEFKNALRFKPNDYEITKKLQEAKEAATINVLIASMDNYGGYAYNNSTKVRNFENEVVRTIRNSINNEFINFITSWDPQTTRVEPDEIIEMRLGTFSIGRPSEESNTKEVAKEVVVKEIVYSKDSVVKQYGKVYAKITTTKRTVVSQADLFLNLMNEEKKPIWNDNLKGEYKWAAEFATYTGDERALSDTDKTVLNKQKQTSPKEEDIYAELLRQLQSSISYRLRSYYNNYLYQ